MLLKNNEAIKYLPCIQQSCKILSSNNESIYVDLFNSAHVNGILVLGTLLKRVYNFMFSST